MKYTLKVVFIERGENNIGLPTDSSLLDVVAGEHIQALFKVNKADDKNGHKDKVYQIGVYKSNNPGSDLNHKTGFPSALNTWMYFKQVVTTDRKRYMIFIDKL